MRFYKDKTKRECVEVVCNRCGKKITVDNDVMQEDVLHVEKVWGYFSSQDGMKQSWDLCEDCYYEFTRSFQLPFEEMEINEYL